MWKEIVTVSFAGGVLCLDRITLQMLLSRPLVVGPVIGLLLGDVMTGFTAGAFVELLWIDRIPMGTYIRPNDSIVGVLVAAVTVMVNARTGISTHVVMPLSILVFVPVGLLSQKVDGLIAESNGTAVQDISSLVSALKMGEIGRIHLAGLGKSFAAYILLIMVPLVFGVLAMPPVLSLFPDAVNQGLEWTYSFVPVLGVAVALTTVKLRGVIPLLAGMLLLVLVLMEVFLR